MSVKNRILSALAANSFGQAVTILSQIALTPFFISSWGAEKYGEWLMLSAIPAYLIMADMGIGSAAANDMTMQVGAGNQDAAKKTFWSMLILLARVSAVVLMVTLAIIFLLHHQMLITLHTFSTNDAALVVALLGAGVCLSFYASLLSAGYRAIGKNAIGILLGNSIRLLEVVITGVLLWFKRSPLEICCITLVFRLTANVLQAVHFQSLAPWLFRVKSPYDKTLIKRLLKPSIGFLAFPIGNALALQAPILIIGAVFGGQMVTIFSTMRTLSRLPMQITNTFNASVWPEMSLAYGAGDFNLLKKLHRHSWQLTALIISIIALVLAVFGQEISHLWLGEQDIYQANILFGLLITTVISALWNANNVVLVAVNAHARVGLYFVVVNAVAVACMSLITIHLGMFWFMLNLILTEVVLMFLVFPIALQVSQDNWVSFAQSLVHFRAK